MFLFIYLSPSFLNFGVMSCYVTEASPSILTLHLAFPVLLPQPSECWIAGTLPLYPAQRTFLADLRQTG